MTLPHQPLFRRGAFVIVESADGLLLFVRRRDGGRWELPGGRVERGERAVVAAARELVEETWLDIRELRRVSRWLRLRSWVEIVTVWHARHDMVAVPATAETLGGEWFAPDALPPLPRLIEARVAAMYAGRRFGVQAGKST